MSMDIESITIDTGLEWWEPTPDTSLTVAWLNRALEGFLTVQSISHSFLSSNFVISFTPVTPASASEIEAAILEVFHNELDMPAAGAVDIQAGLNTTSAPGGVAGLLQSAENAGGKVVSSVKGEVNLLLLGGLAIAAILGFVYFKSKK